MQAKIYKFPEPASARRMARIRKFREAGKLVITRVSDASIAHKVQNRTLNQSASDKAAAEKSARINRLEQIFCKYYRDSKTTYKPKEETCDKNS